MRNKTRPTGKGKIDNTGVNHEQIYIQGRKRHCRRDGIQAGHYMQGWVSHCVFTSAESAAALYHIITCYFWSKLVSDIEKALLAIMIAQELLKADRKILAIKILRFMYHADLPDAKQFVDTLQENIP